MKNLKNILLFEFIGVLVALILSILVVFPFYSNNIEFRFLYSNVLIVFTSITFIRWSYFLKYSFFSYSLILHSILFILTIFTIIVSYGVYGDFKFFFEEANINTLLGHLSFKEAVVMRNYMKTEFTFFSILLMLSSILFGVKLVKSVWKLMNK